jgi:hypothetical protein
MRKSRWALKRRDEARTGSADARGSIGAPESGRQRRRGLAHTLRQSEADATQL